MALAALPSGRQRGAPLDDEIARLDHLHGDRVLLPIDVEYLEILGPTFFLRGEVAVDPAQFLEPPLVGRDRMDFSDRHGFWGRFVKSLQNTTSQRFSVAFHGLGNGRGFAEQMSADEKSARSTCSATRSSDFDTETSAPRENRRRRHPPKSVTVRVFRRRSNPIPRLQA